MIGKIKYRSSNNNIEIIIWNHNSAITVGSNVFVVKPISQIKCLVKGKGGINVTQPAVIGHYSCGIGELDLVDRIMCDYCPMIHFKKCYWPLLMNDLQTLVLSIVDTYTISLQ